jgi:hypothetical protein
VNDHSTQRDDRIRAQWWYDLLWAGLFPLFGWLLYLHFANFETSGGKMRMWAPIAMIYNLTGKWGVVVAGVVTGLFCLKSAVSKFREMRSHRADNDGDTGKHA